jgi:hypothetical protein
MSLQIKESYSFLNNGSHEIFRCRECLRTKVVHGGDMHYIRFVYGVCVDCYDSAVENAEGRKMTEELQPCAHCGGDCLTDYSDAGYYPTDAPCTPSKEIQCDECKVIAPSREAWNRRASPWVKMEEREPEHRQRCFVARREKEAPILCLLYDKDKRWFIGRASCALNYMIDDIHFWMPAPPLPEAS